MKKLSLTALAAFVFAFAVTSSGEVVRKGKNNKNQAQSQIVPVAFVSAPASSVTGSGKVKGKKKATSAPVQALAAPVITTVAAAPQKHRGPMAAANNSPLFLPVANITPTVASVTSSGARSGPPRFKKNVVNPPSTSSAAAAAAATVPEPPFTSLMLLGLFGAGLVMARRVMARRLQPNTVVD